MTSHNVLFAISVFVIALLGTHFLIPLLEKRGVLDVPNSRSLHTTIIPRGGGLAIVLVFLAGAFYLILTNTFHYDYFFLAGLTLLALISFWDDHKNLLPATRLIVQFIAACLVVFSQGGMSVLPLPFDIVVHIPFGLSHVLGVVWCLAIVNIYNFMDGLDGFASVQALIFCIGAGWLFYGYGTAPTLILIGAAVLGFLPHNCCPARIFLGDIGSISLGFIFACFPFYFPAADQQYGFLVTLILLWFFIADGSWAIIKRSLKREKIWLPHKTHLYQRLTVCGWPHWKVVLLVFFFQAVLFLFLTIDVTLSLFVALLLFVFYLLLVRFYETKQKKMV